MPKKYIDYDLFCERISKSISNPVAANWLLRLVKGMPAADVKEVRHGKWVFEVERGSCLDYNVTAKCSECGWEWIGKDGECVGNNRYVFGAFVNGNKSAAERFVLDNAKERKLYDYCPCCGACMENEE